MAEPTKKAPGIDRLLSSLAGRNRENTIKDNVCMICGGYAGDFRDDLSRKEYTISGMCQACQDEVFDNG